MNKMTMKNEAEEVPFTLHLGDCIEVMRGMTDNSVDAVVCDPPYALPGGFMGKSWDNFDGREDAGFGYWLAGFTDGEGHFRVQKHERGSHACAFQLKLRDDDLAALERIKRFTGCGTINFIEGNGSSNRQAVYLVQDKEGCERMVGLFRKYPLTAKKAIDFEIWAEAVEEWIERPRGNRWHGASDQARAAALKARLENVRRYTDVPWSGHKFQDWCRQWATEALRILKPGGHLLAFSGSRTYHRLACAIEDAGFEVRDQILWLYSQGFPKSHNLDGEHQGWGTALKPAHEPVCMARKPLDGTVAANVLAHGTGAINIDACRVSTVDDTARISNGAIKGGNFGAGGTAQGPIGGGHSDGRWPANIIHDGSDEVVELFPMTTSGAMSAATKRAAQDEPGSVCYGTYGGDIVGRDIVASTGSAARFFYCAKASRADRNEGLDSSDTPAVATEATMRERENADWAARNGNHHPTVKPTDLMAYLVRLVTPPGGVVLDPFMGSGSTGKACMREGFKFVGVELDAEYVEIARARIKHELAEYMATHAQLDLFATAAAVAA